MDHLPEGAALVVQDVSWEVYEQILDELVDRPALRVHYDEGRLEITSPLPEHEEHKEFITRLVYALCDELGLNVEPRGSSTWKMKREMKGAEPDSCFYITNADRIIGKRKSDLAVDPPPDLVVEVDATNESLGKFGVYAAFIVPEIWRYDVQGNRASIYQIQGGSYVEASSSRSFPILTSNTLVEFIDQSKTAGQNAALAAFRDWVREQSS